jgi:hypothetical protein
MLTYAVGRQRRAVRELAADVARCSIYLLYWYKRTNTDEKGAAEAAAWRCSNSMLLTYAD